MDVDDGDHSDQDNDIVPEQCSQSWYDIRQRCSASAWESIRNKLLVSAVETSCLPRGSSCIDCESGL